MTDFDLPVAVHPAIALRSEEVFPPDPPVTVLRGALASGDPSYDVVLAEHVPLQPGGGSCRACGFVYTDRRVCPALILAAAGYPARRHRRPGRARTDEERPGATAVGATRQAAQVRPRQLGTLIRPRALGYLRLRAADPPEVPLGRFVHLAQDNLDNLA